MKVKIFSIHAKRTDFLRMHVDSIKYFCQDEFEYYCIDNFPEINKSDFIKSECEKLNVNYIRFDNYSVSGTAWDHAPALNNIKNIANNSDINVILEFDVFLINKFSFIKFIQNYNIAGVYQQRNNFDIEYIAPFVIIVNKDSEFSKIDFSGEIGCDVGSQMRFYFENKNVRWLKHTTALIHSNDSNAFIFDYNPSYGCQVIENSFLHYYRGTNWDQKPEDFENQKFDWLKNALNKSRECDIINYSYLEKYNTPTSHSFRYWNGSDQIFKSKLNPYSNEN